MTTITNFTVNNQLNIIDQSLNVINPLGSVNYEYYIIDKLGTYTITSNNNISSLRYFLVGAGGNGWQGFMNIPASKGPTQSNLYGGAGGGSGGRIQQTITNMPLNSTISLIIGNNIIIGNNGLGK